MTLLLLDPDPLTAQELSYIFTPFDFKRLESYANNSLDFHVVQDLFPSLASLYFQNRLGSSARLTAVQSSILLALGLQRKTVEDVEKELSLPVSQVLALLVKIVRKVGKRIADVRREEVEKSLPPPPKTVAGVIGGADEGEEKGEEWKGVAGRIEEELDEAGRQAQKELRERQKEMLESLDLKK